MDEIAKIALDNEMDLILAHKRSMKLAELAGLSLSAQLSFATAVSELARTSIESGKRSYLVMCLKSDPKEEFIVASHAKPYSVCSIEESDNKFNGLPLLVHLDRLFDSGFISFDSGDLLISSKLPDELINLWNLKNLRLQKTISEVEPFLKWHRENIFIK